MARGEIEFHGRYSAQASPSSQSQNRQSREVAVGNDDRKHGRGNIPRPGTPYAASPSSGTSRLWSSYCKPQTIAAMPRRAACGLTPVVSHRAMNCGGTSTSRTLGCLSMTAFLDSPDAHRGRRWRINTASRAGASRFAPQLASTLTRRARCDTGNDNGAHFSIPSPRLRVSASSRHRVIASSRHRVIASSRRVGILPTIAMMKRWQAMIEAEILITSP
jgi:hypothetical protein